MLTNAMGEQTVRHEELWYEDGNLVLQADDVLFKIHRGVVVRQSDLLRDMFALPTQNPNQQEGTDESPLLLPAVSAAGLSDLLRMMYNLWGSELPLSDNEFVDVLLTAHRLQAHGVVKIVLGVLDGRLPAERKLQIGLQCDLEFWQLRAFQEVVLGFQQMPITMEPLLSDSVWLKVYSARAEISRARADRILSTLASTACGHVAAALLGSVPFASPDEYRSKYKAYRAGFGKLDWPDDVSGISRWHPHPCCSSASFNADGGPKDSMHIVLLPPETESAIIAAAWNPL